MWLRCLLGRAGAGFQVPPAPLLLHGSLSMPPNGLPDIPPTDFAFSPKIVCGHTVLAPSHGRSLHFSVRAHCFSPTPGQSFSSCLFLSFAPSLYPPSPPAPENHPAYQLEETSPILNTLPWSQVILGLRAGSPCSSRAL